MDLALTEGDLIEWLVEPELRADRKMDLGDVLNIENVASKCRGWIGDAPISLDPEATARKLNASNDEWQRVQRPEFSDRFILTTFGVHTSGGFIDPTGIGLELLFRDDSRKLNQGQRIHIHTVFPAARFQVVGTRQGEFAGEFAGDFRAELRAPGQLVPIESVLESLGTPAKLDGSASQKISLVDKRRLTWSSTTYAHIVEAFGEGDTRALWVFYRPDGPLTGKTFETVTGITLGRKKTSIEYDARMFVIFRIGPYPIRRYSPWVRLRTEWAK
jgi:hypothetical protein